MIQTASKLGEEAGGMAYDVETYENSQKLDSSSFYELKKKYTNTLIRNWLTIEKIKKTCDGQYTTILYFYSNKDCEFCEEQGIVLSYFKEKLEDDIMILAFDTDLGVDAVSALKESFEITAYPGVVINGEKYQEFKDKAEITEILCDFNDDLKIC